MVALTKQGWVVLTSLGHLGCERRQLTSLNALVVSDQVPEAADETQQPQRSSDSTGDGSAPHDIPPR
jgi:hypothetical protein